MEEAPWYRPDGSTSESRIMNAIDQGLAHEGYDPTSEEYWEELRERARKRIPGSFPKKKQASHDEDDDDDFDEPAPKRKAPPVGGGATIKASGAKRTITLSRERVEAMKMAGAWDDLEARKRMIKQYEKYDRENKSR
jgi:hypothetical protein